MDCSDLVIWLLVLIVVYFVVRKIISRLRIDRYTDVYVLITGCDTGFGNVAAKRFDRMGCHVFAGCLTEKGTESLKEECSDRLHAISLDVTKIESIREAYDYVNSKLPKGRGLWGVINNAGVIGKIGPLEWLNLDYYRDVFDVNLYGVINVTMTFLPLVKKARGRIVNTASIFGRFSMPLFTPYCMTKFGVEAFTDGLRRSLRPYGVKAVLIEPGAHTTNIISEESNRYHLTSSWDGATPEVKAEYGERYLKEVIGYVSKVLNSLWSSRLTDVVDAYEQGIFGRFPRARYTVGNDCFTFFLPLVYLPEWLGDWLLAHYETAPTPGF